MPAGPGTTQSPNYLVALGTAATFGIHRQRAPKLRREPKEANSSRTATFKKCRGRFLSLTRIRWCPSGPCKTLLPWQAKPGQSTKAWCLSSLSRNTQNFVSRRRRFSGVVAKVFWAEEIVFVLHGPDTALRFPTTTLLCQEQCTPAVSVLNNRDEKHASSHGYSTKGTHSWIWGRPTMDSIALPPHSLLFDSLSWHKEQRTDGKWTGFHNLAAKVCATHSRWLKIAVVEGIPAGC